MNIFTLRVTDAKSLRIRFAFSLVSSVVILVGVCFIERTWRVRGLAAAALIVWSIMELLLDKWRLRNPEASQQRERQLRLRCVVALMIGMFAAVFLVR